tara:strand:- start:765 stop:2132 length:1368 start_codon:yes stop_codon:yes gene_type:complete
MAGSKSIAKPRGRILKTVTPAMSKAIKGIQELRTGHSDLLDSYDALEEKYDADKKNKTLSQKREDLVKTLEEKQVEEEHEKKQKEKDIGASKQTIQTLKRMAADEDDFIRLCDLWNHGDPGIKKSKRVFEELEEAESILWDATMTEAWSNRPLNCHNLRSALLHYSKQFIDIKGSNGSQFLVHGARKIVKFTPEKLDKQRYPDPVKPDSEDDEAPTISVMCKLEFIKRSIAKLDAAKQASQLDVFFPNCYRLCQKQTATSDVRRLELHRGGDMPLMEMYERFPVLRPLPKAKVEATDVDDSAPVSYRPPSPSLVDYKKLEAAEAEVTRLKIINDKYDDDEEVDEEDGGYEGEQGDVFRQVFGDEEEGEDGPCEEGVQGALVQGVLGVLAEAMDEEVSDETGEAAGERSPSLSDRASDRASDRESESSAWRHDDEEMMFAAAMAARDGDEEEEEDE